MRRPGLADVRGAGWACSSLGAVRRQLAGTRLEDVRVPAPPDLPDHTTRAVARALRLRRATCLERALVLQRWLSAHGRRLDVVIGVTAHRDFAAHAWLDGEPQCTEDEYGEITRLPVR